MEAAASGEFLPAVQKGAVAGFGAKAAALATHSTSLQLRSRMGSSGETTVVYWNDKERGIPLEDGMSAPHGLNLSCGACKHSVLMLWADVLRRWPLGTYSRDMATSLKCSQCGERQGCIMVCAHTS